MGLWAKALWDPGGHLGGILGKFGVMLGIFGSMLGVLGSMLGVLGGHVGNHGVHLGPAWASRRILVAIPGRILASSLGGGGGIPPPRTPPPESQSQSQTDIQSQSLIGRITPHTPDRRVGGFKHSASTSQHLQHRFAAWRQLFTRKACSTTCAPTPHNQWKKEHR